ncbi:GlmL-related ornithine degradation protein [Clostridium sp. JN-9]|uniref:GlmL-related ornithine degradation protein n=1 Tax=Clostridium sp. JN-9 TaxID=2507159 RepID=UPI000FFE0CA8|nr:GlmL-related ornithine degradation protein [Clostridium sp. JN-9]QAT40257.1 DNA mismatch repair protein MutL [Clostridium sp. JN-9]
MNVDYVIAEIGSTTTLVTAVNAADDTRIIAQGKSCTTVSSGDVTIGLKNAISDIESQIGESISWGKMLATSSAAGGLKITVHGLMEDMTVKAAKEAALGAGGNIKMITAGRIRNSDLKKIKEINPNLIIIAGGTDYGERDTSLYNAEKIHDARLGIPVVYCGNVENQQEIMEIFNNEELYIVDNVYPKIDELNVEPTRKVIQTAFEKNIIKASGMNKIKKMVNGPIMPTPGAVMESAKLLYNIIGDILVIDVGGATTDVHSVTEGSSRILDILISPEPKAKRTVEGDIGIYVNSENIIDQLDSSELNGLTKEEIRKNIKPIPRDNYEIKSSLILTKKAVDIAVNRHVGRIKRLYGGEKEFVAYGKDLSQVKNIVGTGGALTRLPHGEAILENIKYLNEDITMYPGKEASVFLDTMYIMACAGVLSRENKTAALNLLKLSLKKFGIKT